MNNWINKSRRPKTHHLKLLRANRLTKLSPNQKTLVLENRKHVPILSRLVPWLKLSRVRTPNGSKLTTMDQWTGTRSKRWGRSILEGQRKKLSEVLFALTVTARKCMEVRAVLTCISRSNTMAAIKLIGKSLQKTWSLLMIRASCRKKSKVLTWTCHREHSRRQLSK